MYFPREDQGAKKSHYRWKVSRVFSSVMIKGTARGESRPEFPILCIQCFNPHSNTCTWLPSSDDRKLRDMFLYNDKLYALFLFCKWTPIIFPEASVYHFKKRSGFFITKYNVGSN